MDFHENELVGIYLNDLKTIEHIKSLHQNIILMQHPILGKVLVINYKKKSTIKINLKENKKVIKVIKLL